MTGGGMDSRFRGNDGCGGIDRCGGYGREEGLAGAAERNPQDHLNWNAIMDGAALVVAPSGFVPVRLAGVG